MFSLFPTQPEGTKFVMDILNLLFVGIKNPTIGIFLADYQLSEQFH